MTTHIMIDIEALGIRAGSAIIEIGAVSFCPELGEVGETFSVQIEPGEPFSADLETLLWHYRQGTYDLYNRVVRKGAVDYRDGLAMLGMWLDDFGTIDGYWCWGATYDFPLLSEAFLLAGLPAPWGKEYWKLQCARTVWRMAFGEKRHEDRPHRALDDARAGALDLMSSMAELKGGSGGNIGRSGYFGREKWNPQSTDF